MNDENKTEQDSFFWIPEEKTPGHVALTNILNRAHALRRAGEGSIADLEREYWDSFKSYRLHSGHSNHQWTVKTMEAEGVTVFASFEEGLLIYRECLPLAKTPIERSITHNNLCDLYRRTCAYGEACEHGYLSVCESRGKNEGGVIAFAHAKQDAHVFNRSEGEPEYCESADALIVSVGEAAKDRKSFGKKGDALTAYLLFDEEFANLALPSVRNYREELLSGK